MYFIGPQDAAGGFVKRQADLAILRRKATIQTARDFYEYATEHLQDTRDSSGCARRIFRFLNLIERNRDRQFKSIPQNRTIHQIVSVKEGILSVRNLSCYNCDSCLNGSGRRNCSNIPYIEERSVSTAKETVQFRSDDTEEPEEFTVVDLIKK